MNQLAEMFLSGAAHGAGAIAVVLAVAALLWGAARICAIVRGY